MLDRILKPSLLNRAAVIAAAGTLSAALLTLIVLPVAYAFARRARERLTRRSAERAPLSP